MKYVVLIALGLAAFLFLRKPAKSPSPSAVASSNGSASTPPQYSGLLGSGVARTNNQLGWQELLKSGIAATLGAIGSPKGNKNPFNLGSGPANSNGTMGGRKEQPDDPNPPDEQNNYKDSNFSPDAQYLAGLDISEQFPGSNANQDLGFNPDYAGELGLTDTLGYNPIFDFSGGDAGGDIGSGADFGSEL